MRISFKVVFLLLLQICTLPLFAKNQESKNLSSSREFVLYAPRTEIRMITEFEIDDLLEFMSKPGYQEMNGLSPGEMNRIYLEDDIKRIQASSDQIVGKSPPYAKVAFHFGIWHDGRLIGRVGFKDNSNIAYAKAQKILPEHAAAVAIDYGLHADFRRQGLAREAVSRILRYIFTDLGYKTALAVILDYNTDSQKLARALGFRKVHRVYGPFGRSTEQKVFFYYQLDSKDFKSCEELPETPAPPSDQIKVF